MTIKAQTNFENMRTIYKYQFQVNDFLEINLPVDSKVLTVQMQNDVPSIWVEQDPEREKYKQKFAIFGTGQNMGRADGYGTLEYVGTFQMNDGGLVFHLYKIN